MIVTNAHFSPHLSLYNYFLRLSLENELFDTINILYLLNFSVTNIPENSLMSAEFQSLPNLYINVLLYLDVTCCALTFDVLLLFGCIAHNTKSSSHWFL